MEEDAHRENRNGRDRRIPRPAAVPLAILLLAVLLIPAQPVNALSLLSFREIEQSAGLSYRFLHSSIDLKSGSSRNSEQEFDEDYEIAFKYSILSPQLLKGNARLQLEWQQETKDDDGVTQDSSDFRLRYNIYGILLERRPYPVSFAAFSSRETVSQSFAPSYDSIRDGGTVRLSINNKFSPASITLDRQTQETSGVNQNIRQNVDSFFINAHPSLPGIASFNLSMNRSDSTTTALDTNRTTDYATTTARVGGQKGWKSGQGLSRSLSASYNYRASAGLNPQTGQNLSGNLLWQLGNALDGTLRYLWSTSRAPLSRLDLQSGSMTLTHRLFSSLTTNVNLSADEYRYNEGTSRSYGGGGGFSYTKELPASSRLNLGYSLSLALNERTGQVTELTVQNEEHPIPPVLPRRIALAQPTFKPDKNFIEVIGAQTLLPYPDTFFNIVPEGIELTDFFAGDTAVLITYTYLVDPTVTTSSLSQGISSSVALFQGKYFLYANYRTTQQELVNGSATLLTLTDTLHYDAGMTARLSRHTVSTELGYDENFAQALYYYTASWGYAAPFARGNLSMSAGERYTWRDLAGTTLRGGQWTNSFNVRSEYRRPISFLAGRLKLQYANAMVDGGEMSHNTSVGLNIEGKFGKLFALLHSDFFWSLTGGGSAASQAVGISIRRVF